MSIEPITTTPHPTRMAAFVYSPVSARYTAAGTQTTNDPAIGIIDMKNITTPQSSGDASPRNQKINVPSVPWIAEITSTP